MLWIYIGSARFLHQRSIVVVVDIGVIFTSKNPGLGVGDLVFKILKETTKINVHF